MIINHNMSAMFANRTLDNTGVDIAKDIEKLSSGQRINRAGDDASGLAVSEKLQQSDSRPRTRPRGTSKTAFRSSRLRKATWARRRTSSIE